MEVVLRHRGREVSSDDVDFIRGLINRNPAAARRALSIELCKAWGWVQPNGALRDGVCRGLLLALHRAGHIELPPPRLRINKQPWERLTPTPVEVDATPLETRLSELGLVELCQVRRTPEEALVNGLVQQHHYLGYSQPVGEHLKYLVTAQARPIACFCWSSAPRHLAPRDEHIGWSPPTRKANIRLVAYQTRFLILPWERATFCLLSHRPGRRGVPSSNTGLYLRKRRAAISRTPIRTASVSSAATGTSHGACGIH
jgi:Druantia protein DruA